jgi:DNA replication initiation complex subunit (GINS family)
MLKTLEDQLELERVNSELSSLDEDFFFRLQEHIAVLTSLEDPISKRALQLIEEGVEELIELRAEKILKGCKENMLPAESRLAEFVLTFKKFKRDVLESLLQKDTTSQKVVILRDLPQFYGPELEILGPYKKGEKVLLDKKVATLLKEKGLVNER